MPVTLILGGARSGKSRRAEAFASSLSENPIYVATAPLIEDDAEWLARIERHRSERGANWRLIEEELAIVAVLENHAGNGSVVLVDCLTLWLTNLIYAGLAIDEEIELLCTALSGCSGEVILVSNEVGMGLVPENELGRSFRDAQGRMNQRVAAVADRVEFIAAGLSICIKGEERDGS